MKKFIAICFLLRAVLMFSAAAEAIPVAGNFSVIIPPEAGHQIPITEFLRRFERVCRQFARAESQQQSRHLIVELSGKLSANEVKFVDSEDFQTTILQLPMQYKKWLERPAVGRALTAALLRARRGEAVDKPFPEAAFFVPDGLWSEFTAREKTGQRILRFTDLPGLRNMAENDLNIILSPAALRAPEYIRPDSATWVLYTEKARLLLEVARSLAHTRRGDPLKEFCLTVEDKRFTVNEAFDRTFRAAASKKLSLDSSLLSADSDAAGDALNRLALQKLFSVHISMSASGLSKKLKKVENVLYSQTPGGRKMTAALTDLPHLVEKYEPCLAIPRIKIMQLNDLAAVAPVSISSSIVDLIQALSGIGSHSPERVSREIASRLQTLHAQLNKLMQVENILKQHEQQLMPSLYEQRYSLKDANRPAPLPPLTRKFVEEAEKKLNR